MKRTPMELAAIASAAVPGLAPTGVAGTPDDAADFESALLVDDSGKQWRVRSPKHPEASMRLETELQALRAFSPAVKAELPFLIPHIAGSVRQGELSTFVYSHLTGSARPLGTLADGGRSIAQEIGRMMAAVHDLPREMVQNADLPSYEADECRQRKLNELDQAATTGRIPPVLLRRWEHALEDVALWHFTPTVVHGDLHEDHLLIAAGQVSAVTGWTDLSVGDPAGDFAWLAAADSPSFVDAVYQAYGEARSTTPDPHLARRAALAAEFALAQWLVRGVALEDSRMIAEADGMLATLEADVELIEREQRETAERERLAREERREWGDEAGLDAGNDEGPWGMHEATGDETLDAPGTNEAPDRADRPGGSTAVHMVPTESATQEPRTGGSAGATSTGQSGDERGTPEAEPSDQRSGSSLAYSRLTAGRRQPLSEQGPGSSSAPHATASPDTNSPSGRAATGLSRSGRGKVTVLRSGGQKTGSPDDVSTSALPIISYGS